MLRKTMWENAKFLVMNNVSFSNSVFLHDIVLNLKCSHVQENNVRKREIC